MEQIIDYLMLATIEIGREAQMSYGSDVSEKMEDARDLLVDAIKILQSALDDVSS